jgi:hypothetical protein
MIPADLLKDFSLFYLLVKAFSLFLIINFCGQKIKYVSCIHKYLRQLIKSYCVVVVVAANGVVDLLLVVTVVF